MEHPHSPRRVFDPPEADLRLTLSEPTALALSRLSASTILLRDLRVTSSWGREALPIPLLKPFDSAQGEREYPAP